MVYIMLHETCKSIVVSLPLATSPVQFKYRASLWAMTVFPLAGIPTKATIKEPNCFWPEPGKYKNNIWNRTDLWHTLLQIHLSIRVNSYRTGSVQWCTLNKESIRITIYLQYCPSTSLNSWHSLCFMSADYFCLCLTNMIFERGGLLQKFRSTFKELCLK